MNVVSDSIKKLRKEKGMTQDELAEKLCVTRQAVSNWEQGKTQPDVDTLTKLAEIFGVSVERIIYGKEKSRRRNYCPAPCPSQEGLSCFVAPRFNLGYHPILDCSCPDGRSSGWLSNKKDMKKA